MVAYIPITKFVGIPNKAGRHCAQVNLFHVYMQHLLALISAAGETGIEIVSREGIWRLCHPIFAAFVGEYPEQALVSCTYYGHCLKCTIPYDQLGDFEAFP